MKNAPRHRPVAYALLFIALAHFGFNDAHAVTVDIIAPNANAVVEGSIANVFPFATTSNSTFPDGFRYQQIYGASEFSALTGPGNIKVIAFRPDTSALISGVPTALLTQPFGPYILPNMLVKLSTTSKAVDGLDLTFANNVGADETVVYNGTIALASAFTGGAPKDFDFVIRLTTPFVYDPAAGNLLLDIQPE